MDPAIEKDATSDTELMIRYRDGDLNAFNELYGRHKAPLYRFIMKSCTSEAIAAELFQDVWARVVNGRQGYAGSAPFPAWLYRIARNRLIDFYRSNKHQNLTTTLDTDSDTHVTQLQTPLGPDEIAELHAREDALSTALLSLPAQQREVVLLRHIAGFSMLEIADIIDENAETVKSRLRYALSKLRKQLRMLS